jgi:cytochrome c2
MSTPRSGAGIVVAVGAAALVWASPLSALQAAYAFGDPTVGEQLFTERGCVRCHAIWGNGGELGPDLGRAGRGRSLLQLAGMFWNHTPRMIETVRSSGLAWSTFTEAELANVISYIYYVKLFDEPGDPVIGAQWVIEKRCTTCHQIGGQGGRFGPSLDRYAQYIAPIPLAAGMWNHGRGMRSQLSAAGLPMPEFFGDEISHIQAYIRAASHVRGRKPILLPPPDPAEGQRLFRAKACSLCHGASGRGTSLGPDLRSGIQALRVSEIAGDLWNHSALMTQQLEARGVSFPEFDDTELANVIAFLYYLRFEELDGDVAAGEELFASKGCLTCHQPGVTSQMGPSLTDSEVVEEPLSLTTAMWNHAPGMYDLGQQAGIAWPLFQGDEMRDLAAYMRSLRDGGS